MAFFEGKGVVLSASNAKLQLIVFDLILFAFGVPAALLPAVRAVKTPDGLLALSKHLPAEAAEALMWLEEGLPVEEVASHAGTISYEMLCGVRQRVPHEAI